MAYLSGLAPLSWLAPMSWLALASFLNGFILFVLDRLGLSWTDSVQIGPTLVDIDQSCLT